MSRTTFFAIAGTILLLSAAVLPAADPKPGLETFTGKVAGAVDGDTLTLMVRNTLRKIRLYGIDAPERKQPFGEEAKQVLAKGLVAKTVEVRVMGKNAEGLVLGVVRLDGRCVNTELVRQGFAWREKEADKSPTLTKAEAEARKKKRGLWAAADPMSPWEWRRIEAEKLAAEKPPATEQEPQSGGQKTYWLNTSTNTRHNNTCRFYKKTEQGRPCTANEGTACKICGG